MRDLVLPAADLLLGARCAGCGGPAMLLCRACGHLVRPRPEIVHLARDPGVPAMAAGAHAAVLRRVVLAWKEEGVTRLTDVLAHHLAASIVPHLTPGRRVVLVPVPTSRRGRRARGCDVVDELARAAAALLRGPCGAEVRVEQGLVHERATRDQAGLDAAERRGNLDGAFRARRTGSTAGDVVVVDDVLTTGATVAEAVRALRVAGRRPIGIGAIAATPRPS